MKSTRALLLATALSLCWGVSGAEAQTGTIEGTALLDGALPASGLRVGAYALGYPYVTAYADDNGHYVMTSVPTGVPVGVYVAGSRLGLGYHIVSPAGGGTTVTLDAGATATVNFALETIEGGSVRGLGWWRHQVNSLTSGHGNTECSAQDMNLYASRMADRYIYSGLLRSLPICAFSNIWIINRWRLYYSADSAWCAWYDFLNPGCYAGMGLVQWWGERAEQWGPHVIAVCANLVSGRLHSADVVSEDGATASQALLEICALSGGIYEGPTAAAAEAMKDIAEAMNEGRMIPAGVIDLTRPTWYWTHAMPSAPVVDQVRVTPNPMVKSSTLDFEVTTPGQVEVRVFDIAGRAVRTLVDRELPSGPQTAIWDGTHDGGTAVANGVYFYRIEMPGCAPLTTRFAVMR